MGSLALTSKQYTQLNMKLKDLLPFSCKAPSTSSRVVSRGRKELHTLYTVKEEIGRGGFGVVFSAERKSDGLEVAIKEVSKDIDMLTEDNIPLEVALMQQVNDVPGVIKLLDYFDTADSFYVVMERFNSKDLFDFITEQGPLPENLAKDLFMQLVDTVNECHEKGVVHRDIKDENILIDINTFKIKLIDFGSGASLKEGLYHKFKGTRVYSPPEWFKQLNLSSQVKDLITSCLAVDPSKRITLCEVLDHPWGKTRRMESSSFLSSSPSSSLSSSVESI